MAKMSRDKGKVGEREAAALIRSFGFDAKRGVQYSGGTDSPDVQHSIPGIHIEVKRVEKLNIRMAMKQAREDASGQMAVVMHRPNKETWLATMEATDWLLIMQNRQRERGILTKISERSIDPPVIIKELPDDNDYQILRNRLREAQSRITELEYELNGQDIVGNDPRRAGQSETGIVGGDQEAARGDGFSGARLVAIPSRSFDVV